MSTFHCFRQLTIVAALALTGNLQLEAQFYATGDPPGNIRWRQIRTGHFRIVFPEGYEEKAREYAISFDQAYLGVSRQLDHFPRPVPIVLHPHISRSNGIVVWAPRRMEIYPVPPQQTYPQTWREQLALHETRHVVQISKLSQGFTRALGWFIGEQATGIAAGMVPSWFLEGDAIYAETSLSSAGRGRSPAFEMGIRALLADEKSLYSYDKSLFGSYQDQVPNHYEYGYQLVSYASEKFGQEFWSHTLAFTGRYPFVPFAFRSGMKKQQGISPRELYESALDHRRSFWREDDLARERNRATVLSPEKSDYVNYYSPRIVSDSLLVALKDGPGVIRQIVLLRPGQPEETIHVPGFLSVNRISAGGDRIAWSETMPDPRWGNQSFSDIKVFDLKKHTEVRLGRQTALYAPALSPAGERIAAIENDADGNYFLVVLDAESGTILLKIPAPENSSLQLPEWSGNQEIIMTSLHSKGKDIIALDITSMNWETLVQGGRYDLSAPAGNSNFIWFRSTWDGTGNIFSLDRSTGRVYKISSSRFGSFEPVVHDSGESLLFSDYTSQGFEIHKIFAEASMELFEIPTGAPEPFYPSQKKEPVIFQMDPDRMAAYPSRPYRKPLHLFHFHSWAPFYYDFQDINPAGTQEIYPGITLLSQNILNTAVGQFSYAWKNDNHFLSNRLTYSGSLIVTDLGMEYGDEPLVFKGLDTEGPGNVDNDLLRIYSRFYIPLNMTTSRFVTGMTPSLQISYNNSYYHYTDGNIYKRGNVSLDWRFSYYRYLKLSMRDISPRWGHLFRLRYYTSPFEDENLGSIFSATGIFYFPGLLQHHSIRLSGSHQKQNPLKYLYVTHINFPRGYLNRRTEILQVLNLDYNLPLAYPDLTIPGILYLKRLRADLFADMAFNQYRVFNNNTNTTEWRRQNLSSIGLELVADYHFLRLMFPFSTGIRLSYLAPSGTIGSEMIFSVNLNIF